MERDYNRLSKGMVVMLAFNAMWVIFNECKDGGYSNTQAISYVLYRILNKLANVGAIHQHVEYIRARAWDSNESYQNVFDSDVFEDNDDERKKKFATANKKIIWFVPNCSNVFGGGHYTLFRFANYFANHGDTTNIIFIYNYVSGVDRPIVKLENDLKKALPDCKLIVETNFYELPQCEAAIATTWQSAYFVKKFSKSKEKFYFMQDYESLFYPAGTLSLQANYTYSFGFHGITGGTWLKERYESHGGKAINYVFSTDRNIFYPENKTVRDKVTRLFFYGRPSTERRAHELGMAALSLIAEKFPNIEIVMAGLDGVSAPTFKCTMLGNLTLKQTGELYRTCDIGIALSATNLSYLPVELMASGCAVVTNSGPQVEWYCKDRCNSLVADPTPQAILKCFSELVESKELRSQLVKNGLDTASETTWENEMDKVFTHIIKKIS